MKLLIATQNPGKIKELTDMLSAWKEEIEIIVPEAMEDVEETGTTFEENARIKAMAFAHKFPSTIAIADDSGLVVDALDGRPGVYSKRYGKDDQDRNTKLLAEMEGKKNRKAKFVASVCIYGAGFDECFSGEVHGKIGFEPKGAQGFGYDPIFIPNGYSEPFGELGSEVKNTLSHRAKALEKVKEFFEKKVFKNLN